MAKYKYLGTVTPSDEPWLVRTISVGTGTRIAAFRDAVRDRDRRCIITGKMSLDGHRGFWQGFEAAHIFPLAYERHWTDYDYSRWITVPATRGGSINSVQNGVLLRRDIATLFKGSLISINSDVRIACLSGATVANSYFRTITRLFASGLTGLVLLVTILINDFLKIHFDQSTRYSAGISDSPVECERGVGQPSLECDY